jgi:WD40 repeat protein
LWDTSSGQELLTLLGHSAPIRSLAFSADGQTLASGSEDGTVKLWDVDSGQELLTLSGHANTVTGLAFASDGQSLISASDDWTVREWDLDSEAATTRLPSYIEVVESYPADVDLCQAEVQIDSALLDDQWLVSGSLVFVDNQFSLNCYGVKLTVNTALELDGQPYEAGDLLTVDQNLDWIQVSSWDGSEPASLTSATGDGTLHDLSSEGFTLRLPQEWIALDLEKMDFPELLEDMGQQNERLEGMLSSSVMQNMVAAGFKFYAINTIDDSLQADLPINK